MQRSRIVLLAASATFLSCATPLDPSKVSISVRTSGEYKPARPIPALISDGRPASCALGTMLGTHFDLAAPDGARGVFPLVAIWTHPPLRSASAGDVTTRSVDRWNLPIPDSAGVGTLLAWTIDVASEQVEGEYEQLLLGPGDRVLYRRTFTVSGCPPSA